MLVGGGDRCCGGMFLRPGIPAIVLMRTGDLPGEFPGRQRGIHFRSFLFLIFLRKKEYDRLTVKVNLADSVCRIDAVCRIRNAHCADSVCTIDAVCWTGAGDCPDSIWAIDDPGGKQPDIPLRRHPHKRWHIFLTAAYISFTVSIPENSRRIAWNCGSWHQMISQAKSIPSWTSGRAYSSGAHG